MKIAVVGCSHGSLDEIYRLIGEIEAEQKITISLLIICGDFQALRNPADFECIAVPPKYREMGTFHRYYSGAAEVPVLTIFIGGNHEASNYLQELPYGGWVAPGIYYMGLAGVVKFGGLRIAGMSGIFKSGDFGRGHYECLAYNESEKRSIYHVRSLEHFRLKLLEPEKIDIFLSHDWPRGIWQYGNLQELLRWKPYFRQDIENGMLGSPPAEELLAHLRPRYYFAGHMHCRFAAKVPHQGKSNLAGYGVNQASSDGGGRETCFLALDKVLPRRRFLEIVDVPCQETTDSPQLELDPEWLCIVKNTAALWSYASGFTQLPTKQETIDSFKPTKERLQEMVDDFGGEFAVPENFQPTAPPFDGVNNARQQRGRYNLNHYLNSQTSLICQMLEIENPNVEWGRRASRRGVRVIDPAQSGENEGAESESNDKKEKSDQTSSSTSKQANPDEIVISEGEGDEVEAEKEKKDENPPPPVVESGGNPDEIHFSFDDEDEQEEVPPSKKPKSDASE